MRTYLENGINIGILDGDEDTQDLLNIDGYRAYFKSEIFALESWSASEAINYICGVSDIELLKSNPLVLDHVITLEDINFTRSFTEEPLFKELEKKFFWVKKLWESGTHKDKNPIHYYIDWAKEKNISIPWLSFYEENFDKTNLDDNKKVSLKTHNNLLRAIGALNEILLRYPIQTLRDEQIDNKSSNAIAGDLNKPVFKNQAELIRFIEKKYDGIAGLSKRQLEDIFPQAKRELDQ